MQWNMGPGPPNNSLNPGTGGVRDTYDPSEGTAWSQAEYAAETERDTREGRKRVLSRVWLTVRRWVWGE